MTGHDGAYDPPPSYLCNCGRSFPSHLARTAHAASCQVMAKYAEATDLRRRTAAAIALCVSFDPTSGSGRARTFVNDLLDVLDPQGAKAERQTRDLGLDQPDCDGRCDDGRAVCTLWHGAPRKAEQRPARHGRARVARQGAAERPDPPGRRQPRGASLPGAATWLTAAWTGRWPQR